MVALVLGLIAGLIVLPMVLSSLWYRFHPRKGRGIHFSPAAGEWAAARFSPEFRAIAAFVADLLREQLGVGFAQLEPETSFIEDLHMIDLEPVEVVMALEQELGFEIPDEDCESLATISALVLYLHRRLHASHEVA